MGRYDLFQGVSAFSRNRDPPAEASRQQQTKVCLKKVLHYVAKYNLIITLILQVKLYMFVTL